MCKSLHGTQSSLTECMCPASRFLSLASSWINNSHTPCLVASCRWTGCSSVQFIWKINKKLSSAMPICISFRYHIHILAPYARHLDFHATSMIKICKTEWCFPGPVSPRELLVRMTHISWRRSEWSVGWLGWLVAYANATGNCKPQRVRQHPLWAGRDERGIVLFPCTSHILRWDESYF